MNKIIVNVQGMACPRCEARVTDCVTKAFPVKKVTASHAKGTVEILCKEELDKEALKAAIEAAGYPVLDIHCAKAGFLGLFG